MPGFDQPTTTQLDLVAVHFGKRLKHWRLTRQLTQAELARELNLDGSYVSKLESSRRRPSVDIAEQCDRLLDTGGELADLLTLVTVEPAAPRPQPAPAPLPAPAPIAAPPAVAGPHAATALNRLAEAYADVNAAMGGQHLGATVERLAQEVVALHLGSPEATAGGLLRTAARFARLAADIRTDALDDTGARYWSDCAGRWAVDGGDTALAAEICARAAIAYADRDQAPTALNLAARVEKLAPDTVAATVWSLLARAHAHAATADPDATLRQLAAARTLLPRLTAPLMNPPTLQSTDFLWHWHVGTCHLTLADHGIDPAANARTARTHLRDALSEASIHHTRDLALTRLRLARAHLHADNPEAADAELTEAAAVATGCASPRLHGELATVRTLLAPPHN